MRKLFTILALCFTLGASAATDKDTVAVHATQIERIIQDKGVSSKGKEYIKYYAVMNGEPISVSKTVIERIALCKKHNLKCALAGVRNKNTKKIIRIILD